VNRKRGVDRKRYITRFVPGSHKYCLFSRTVWSRKQRAHSDLAATGIGFGALSRSLKNAPTEAVAGFCLVTAALAALCHAALEPTIVPSSAGQWLAILGLGLGRVGLAFYI
jgi:hypothetical protein